MTARELAEQLMRTPDAQVVIYHDVYGLRPAVATRKTVIKDTDARECREFKAYVGHDALMIDAG